MTTSTTPSSAGINRVLWIVQVILAVLFGMAGFMKTTMPIPELSKTVFWAADVPVGLVRFIGLCESLAVLGLILPSLLRIRPSLTVLAGLGLVAMMTLASAFHISRGEFQVLPMNIAFGLLAGFVAWGRSKKAVIIPK